MGVRRQLGNTTWATALGFALVTFQLAAHTLPISYLFVVVDRDYVHLELSFNPFELANFSELDTNRNSRLDAEELAFAEKGITSQLLSHLTLRANRKSVTAETAGISPEVDTHHATLRAHYPVDARHATLTLESTLQDVTSSSHLTQVNFFRNGKRELAELDFQSHRVTFAAPAGARCDPTLPDACAACSASSSPGPLIAMAVTFGFVLLLAFQQSRPRVKPPSVSDRNPNASSRPVPPTTP